MQACSQHGWSVNIFLHSQVEVLNLLKVEEPGLVAEQLMGVILGFLTKPLLIYCWLGNKDHWNVVES